MTFSSETRTELSRQTPAKRCCLTAELSAIIRVNGSLRLEGSGEYRMLLRTGNAALARKVLGQLTTGFGLSAETTVERSRLRKANRYEISVPWQPRLSQTLNELGVLDDSLSVKQNPLPRVVRRECCQRSFLRGLFLGAGSVSDPGNRYHFELRFENRALAEETTRLMTNLDVSPGIYSRREQTVVFLKNRSSIVKALALIGAYSASLKWEDSRVLRIVREEANRLVNCDTANVKRTTSSALRQLEDIDLLDEAIGLDRLPKGLAELASTRRANPQATLRELGERCMPALSKSAVNHRLRRLRVMAEGIRG